MLLALGPGSVSLIQIHHSLVKKLRVIFRAVSSRAAAELEAAWDSTSPFLLREDNCYTSKHHPRDPDNRASGTGAIKERWVLITKCSLV